MATTAGSVYVHTVNYKFYDLGLISHVLLCLRTAIAECNMRINLKDLYHGLLYFSFEVACSLIVLDCTLGEIQPNIQGGGAKLQRTVPVYQCRYQILHGTVLSTFDMYTNLP